jgi:fused signal recognition particle receptor
LNDILFSSADQCLRGGNRDGMNIISRLREGLSKTRVQIQALAGRERDLTEDFYEVLEEALVTADIGLDLVTDIIERLKMTVREERITQAAAAYGALKKILADDLRFVKEPEEFPPKPWVILVVGVNGVGKTTTIGKLAAEFSQKGKKIMLGAADTFRAGAIEQLKIWSQRTGAQFISQHEGADAASVAFDAMEAAGSRDIDVLILDTAGRLHTKVNLMNELEKVVRVIKRHTPYAPNEILLVVDATSGQNTIKQVEAFHTRLTLTGLIITKLDGTAKGGIAFALTKKYRIPIRKIGVGEGMDDLQDFDPEAYVESMFGNWGDAGGAPH